MRWTTVSHVIAQSATIAHGRPPQGAKTSPAVMMTTRSAREPKPDVGTQAESLGLRARVGDEERSDHRGDRDDDRPALPLLGEDERDRGEHRALADTIRRRVEERPERRRLPADSRERSVEDVEDRADDEDPGREPVDEPRVPVLERDEDGSREAE